MRPIDSRRLGALRTLGLLSLVLGGFVLASCSESTTTADNGGIGGTGVTQGRVDAFGSIFVTGVEWDLSEASVELDGDVVSEADLRLGMNVRVIGEIASDGRTGVAREVVFDTTLTGPIEAAPVPDAPDGSRVRFSVLGRSVTAEASEAVFGPGLAFATLAADQLVRISGYVSAIGDVRAQRVDLVGLFPGVSNVEIEGAVANPVQNPGGSGVFDLGVNTVRYTPSTVFSDLSAGDLRAGVRVDVIGTLRPSGNEIDATRIEAADDLFARADFEDIEVTGLVSSFVSLASFEVGGVPVDASMAALEPPGLVLANGVLVEVEGRLEAGVLMADSVEDEDDEGGGSESADLRAATTRVDAGARELDLLGILVVADGDTELEDERDELPNFGFDDIVAGDWLKVEGRFVAPDRVLAKSIHRKSVEDDVVLEGPVTMLDPGAPPTSSPSLDVAGQPIAIDGSTQYFDALGQPRTEEQFFRSPGDVSLGASVSVKDESAVDASALLEADEVSLD